MRSILAIMQKVQSFRRKTPASQKTLLRKKEKGLDFEESST
jgi:hypothetical protein